MALRVWLPLIGSLENKGLSGTKPENSGAVVDSSGKLGSCYSFGGSNFIDTKFVENFGTGDFTVSAWIYIIQTAGKTYQCIVGNKARAANSAGFSIYWNQNQKKFMWSTADGSATTEIWTSETFDSIVYNSWHHIAMVRNSSDPKKGYFYFDGIRKEIASVPAIRNVSTSTTVKIGSITPVDTAYYFTGKINDVRIYDHALSAREVQEISKGLVAHYPLNDPDLSSNKLYDCSGNGYHGTCTAASRPVLATDSPRRSRCVKFDTTAKYFQITNLPALGDNYTFSWWGWWPNSSANAMFWGYQNGNRFNLYKTGNKLYCNTGNGTNNPFYTSGTTVAPAVGLGVWRHYAITGDGTSSKLYVNGGLYATAKTFTSVTGTTLFLNGWDTGTSYKLANVEISDFRLYATALSADQVKELYNNPVSVCKSGNLMCMEVVEP